MIKQFHELTRGTEKLWFDEDLSDVQQCFAATASTKILAGSHGRQAVHEVLVDGTPLVLRHYYRGGFPAYLTKDRYLFRGWQQTRSYRELILLQQMIAHGLPVPQPAAARVERKGLFYVADIATLKIEGAKTLAQLLCESELERAVWSAVGKTIRSFHQLGFQHVDLNARNILFDLSGKIYLIDFDRCIRRPYAKTWAQAGVERLQRSLVKIRDQEPVFNFSTENFAALRQGYE